MATFLGSAVSGDDLCERMKSVYEYLLLPSSALDYFYLDADAKSFLSSITQALRYILHEQRKHRQRQGEESIDSPALTLEGIEDWIIPKSFYLLEHQYVEGWTVDQWDKWQTMVDAVIGGFARGRIPVGPSVKSSRFGRDPDGLCMCTVIM